MSVLASGVNMLKCVLIMSKAVNPCIGFYELTRILVSCQSKKF